MADETSGQEKTEAATPKRRADARKKGQVAKSRDLPGAVALLAAGMFFWLAGGDMIEGALEIMRVGFSNVVRPDMTSAQFQEVFLAGAADGISLLTPLMFVMVVVGVFANVAQTGPVLSINPLQPKWSKISPVEGVKRIFSVITVVELVKSILKIALIGITVHLVVKGEIDRLPSLAGTSIESLLPYLGSVSLKIVLLTGFLLLVLGVMDFAFQHFQNEKKMRMSKEEVKREMKETDGDPLVKARIRSVQREAASKRMMADVPDADVVVTNPTHLAIAIKYSADDMAAPKVLAKGAGHVATKIREIAKENGVPILEDKPLARALFKSVEIGQEVPMDLYQAVAEILAFVYRLNDKNKKQVARA
jgi:flagellar biosynthetic protein FlhB